MDNYHPYDLQDTALSMNPLDYIPGSKSLIKHRSLVPNSSIHEDAYNAVTMALGGVAGVLQHAYNSPPDALNHWISFLLSGLYQYYDMPFRFLKTEAIHAVRNPVDTAIIALVAQNAYSDEDVKQKFWEFVNVMKDDLVWKDALDVLYDRDYEDKYDEKSGTNIKVRKDGQDKWLPNLKFYEAFTTMAGANYGAALGLLNAIAQSKKLSAPITALAATVLRDYDRRRSEKAAISGWTG